MASHAAQAPALRVGAPYSWSDPDDRSFDRRCVVSKASARSRSEPLASSTPRASSCRTKSSNWSEASASRKVKRLDPMSSPHDRMGTSLPVGIISGELGKDGAVWRRGSLQPVGRRYESIHLCRERSWPQVGTEVAHSFAHGLGHQIRMLHEHLLHTPHVYRVHGVWQRKADIECWHWHVGC